MPFIYTIAEGYLIHHGKIIGHGYSGFGDCKNDPLSTHVPNLGPIPCGAWYIGPETVDETLGPVAFHLIPLSGTETYGRHAFAIHGENVKHMGASSHGCPVFDRPIREIIGSAQRDRQFIVVPSLVLVPPDPVAYGGQTVGR